jgi:hypothetical protein
MNQTDLDVALMRGSNVRALLAMLACLAVSACAAPTTQDTRTVKTTTAQTVIAELTVRAPSPTVAAILTVGTPPLTRFTPQFNPFANLTQQQKDCLIAAWGAQTFQDIVNFVRPPSPEEAQASAKCGLALGGPGQPPGGQLGTPPAGGQLPPPGSQFGTPAPVGVQPPSGTGPSVFKDQVFYATSADGLAWSVGTLLSEKASVPEVIRTSKGVIWAYWVDFSTATGPSTEKIGVARSGDGKAWEKLGMVQFSNIGNIVPVDPDVIELDDGRLRMYFYDIAVREIEHPIYSALSSDGINYLLEPGVRFKAENIYDPDVIRLKDGRYRMYLNNDGRITSAASSDGLVFTADGGMRLQERGAGVPGSIVLADGSIRLYACVKGISAYKSADGLNFDLERESVIRGSGVLCDPSVTAMLNGYLMLYKFNPGQ